MSCMFVYTMFFPGQAEEREFPPEIEDSSSGRASRSGGRQAGRQRKCFQVKIQFCVSWY